MNAKVFLLSFVALGTACGGASKNQKDVSPDQGESAGAADSFLDARKISFAMRGNEDDYRKCFMQSIGSRGFVSLGFSINERGEVESATIEHSSIGKDSVGACLVSRMKEQRFGEQPGKSRGRWTFVFNLTDPISEDEREEMLEEADKRSENSFQLLPDSSGTIDAGRVDEIVQVNYPLYAHCYRDSIRRRGESRGLLRLRLQIDERGRLVHVDDAGSVLPDPYAVDCMAEAFFAMDFPKPTGGPVSIKYGIDFE